MTSPTHQVVSSWGRLRSDAHQVVRTDDRRDLVSAVTRAHASNQEDGARPVRSLAAGMRRSYGDVGTNAGGLLWDIRSLNRFIAFDSDTGLLRCEAGVPLRDIQETFAPRGWMLAVAPGTAMATVGGAIANDVHGKNHHTQGTFGHHVVELTLLRTDGDEIICSRTENAPWFAATVAGLGLTGIIVEATVQLLRVPGPWIATDDVVFESLPEFFDLAERSAAEYEHTVGWIDVTTDGGRRGIVTRGDATAAPGRPEPGPHGRSVPFVPPISFVQPTLLPAMNRAYFGLKAARSGRRVEHYSSFFAPLDALHGWNKLYGPKGFYQFQSVVPPSEAEAATAEMLSAVAASCAGSFLGVLKTFGGLGSPGLLSFPREGVTFALDFPNRGAETLALLDRLDSIVASAGGRLYPAKDARMPRALFEAGYPSLDEFLRYRDPGVSSDLSRRLLGS